MTYKTIKNSLLLFALCFCFAPLSIRAQEDAISKYFDQYLEDENFTVVYITPKMFQMISKLDLKDPSARDIKEVLQDLRGLRILNTDHDGIKYYKEAISKFNVKEYELLMTVRDKDENVRFWTKEKDGIISELLMLVGEKEEFTLISFIGNINLDKISKLANTIKIDGIEHLKDLKEKKN
jgi:hypothetical protein